MSIEQARRALKDGYEEAGFEVVDVIDGVVFLRYPDPRTYDVLLYISEEDATEYAEMMALKGDFVARPGDCSICSAVYREHLVYPLDTTIPDHDLRDFYFKRSNEKSPLVEIDSLSYFYANFCRFEPGYVALCIDRLYLMPKSFRRKSNVRPVDIRNILARPTTIQVSDMQAESVEEALQLSTELIESSLFLMAYEYDLPIVLANSWPQSRFEKHKNKTQRLASRTEAIDLVIPVAAFRTDLVRLYQAGLSSQLPTQQFISYYQVLEYFFDEMRRTKLYDQLGSIIQNGAGDAKQTLPHIVEIVESSEDADDIVALLETLLRQHMGETYEDTVSVLANRLRTIRDSIVFAGLNRQHLPFPVDSEAVIRDVPLIKFLAERVILATAEE